MPNQSDVHLWHPRHQPATAGLPAAGIRAESEFPRSRCANPSCRRGWMGLFKDRRRPIFEGRWACSGPCVRELVDSAIRREFPATPPFQPEHQHRIPLGLLLLTRGWITQPQLHHALALQRQAGGGRIGRWLIEECGVPEERILNALALQWHCNVFSLENFEPSQMVLAAPRELVDGAGMVPLRVSRSGTLRLAFADRPNPAAAFALERMVNFKVESGLLSHAAWKSAREALLLHEPVPCLLEELPDRATLSRRVASDLAGLQPRASRLVRLHRFFWLRMWLEASSLQGQHGNLPASREDVLDRLYTLRPPTAA